MEVLIYRFLADDHARLGNLLQRVAADPNEIDRAAYTEFRAGLLKHIGMEEKILLPYAEKRRGGGPLPIAGKLRLDHGALAALLVPNPTPRIIATIRKILDQHNAVEEGIGGLYEACEELAGDEAEALLGRLRSAPEVRTAPHVDGPQVMEAAKRTVERAGYRLAE